MLNLSPLDRRAQYLIAGSTVISASETSDFEDDDEEALRGRTEEEDYDSFNDNAVNPRSRPDSFVGELDWDEGYENNDRASHSHAVTIPRNVPGRHRSRRESRLPHDIVVAPREDSPLLHKKVSFSPPHPNQKQDVKGDSTGQQSLAEQSYLTVPLSLPHRRLSTTSARSSKNVVYNYGGKSTFGQTVFSLSRFIVYMSNTSWLSSSIQ